MVGRTKARQGRSRRSKQPETNEVCKHEVERPLPLKTYKSADSTTKIPSAARLVKANTASTLDRHMSVKEEVEDSYYDLNDASSVSMSQRGTSAKKRDPSLSDPMWNHYPKQVQNILKKKRIDRERLRRSLKPPGKRNYKTLFANIKKISDDQVNTSSSMFKEMKDVYYNLINAEKKVYKALHEKGLFLDQKDFNIMEVFNNYSDYYSDECSEDDYESRRKEKHDDIYVEEFESTSAKNREEKMLDGNDSVIEIDFIKDSETEKRKNSNLLDLPSVDHQGTPNSNTFERISHISKNTGKSFHTFGSKNSHRNLFAEYPTEKRPIFCAMPKLKPGEYMCH